uniref:Uncharacterized protein n=1 Tax=virus sp. ct6GG30 TaxID=2825804 RepID=A0A8S5RLE2_9VIRU|nr:MAG TPA: hypothetical protein [virus sp. ct6GG30]
MLCRLLFLKRRTAGCQRVKLCPGDKLPAGLLRRLWRRLRRYSALYKVVCFHARFAACIGLFKVNHRCTAVPQYNRTVWCNKVTFCGLSVRYPDDGRCALRLLRCLPHHGRLVGVLPQLCKLIRHCLTVIAGLVSVWNVWHRLVLLVPVIDRALCATVPAVHPLAIDNSQNVTRAAQNVDPARVLPCKILHGVAGGAVCLDKTALESALLEVRAPCAVGAWHIAQCIAHHGKPYIRLLPALPGSSCNGSHCTVTDAAAARVWVELVPHERPSFCGYRTKMHRRERQRMHNEGQKRKAPTRKNPHERLTIKGAHFEVQY